MANEIATRYRAEVTLRSSLPSTFEEAYIEVVERAITEALQDSIEDLEIYRLSQ